MKRTDFCVLLTLLSTTGAIQAKDPANQSAVIDANPSLREAPSKKPGPSAGAGPGASTGSPVDLCGVGSATPPDSASALYEQGEAQERAGDLAGAARAYHEALCVAPNFVKANMGLGWIRATATDPELRNAAEAVRLAERGFECMMRQLNQRTFRDAFPPSYSRFEAIQVGAVLGAAFAAKRFFTPVVTAEIASESGGDARVAFSLASTYGQSDAGDRGIGADAAIYWAFEASDQLLKERIATYGEGSQEANEAAELRRDVDALVTRFLSQIDATGVTRPGWFDSTDQ